MSVWKPDTLSASPTTAGDKSHARQEAASPNRARPGAHAGGRSSPRARHERLGGLAPPMDHHSSHVSCNVSTQYAYCLEVKHPQSLDSSRFLGLYCKPVRLACCDIVTASPRPARCTEGELRE
jgi:hypothetical protein